MDSVNPTLTLVVAVGFALWIWFLTFRAWVDPEGYLRSMRRHGPHPLQSSAAARRTLFWHRIFGLLFSAAFLLLVINRLIAVIRPTP